MSARTQALLMVVALAAIARFTTPYMACASVAYALMLLAMGFRKRRPVAHYRLMIAALAIDLMLVLVLQFQRGAIQTAVDLSLTPLQQMHIGVSTLALLLYFPIVYLGYRKITRGFEPRTKLWHRNLGITAFCFRTAGFLLMFSMLSHVRS